MKKESSSTEKKEDVKLKKCFVIMPIADNPEYEAGHFDRVYNHLIIPACINAGYEPVRADDTKASNMIMLDVLRSIVDCDMAICDLSSRNANVFYELGLRQAFDKKTILIRDGRHDVPFDLLGFRYVNYSSSLRVDTVKKEISDISEMLQKTDEANINDANSIVSILKMKPAEIDAKNLNAEQSLMFELLGRMKNLENSVRDSNSSKNRYFNNSNIYNKLSHSYSSNKNNIKENIPPTLINFDEAMSIFGDEVNSVLFTYEENLIGEFKGISSGKFLTFVNGAQVTRIPNSDQERAKIFLSTQ